MAEPQPDRTPSSPEDQAPHDILAAEEFVLPTPDPKLHREPPHDVLAAEEFAVPDSDPELHHGPVTLPEDPTGIAEPHDVLAAEEFALPAPPHHHAPRGPGRMAQARTVALLATAAGVLLLRRRTRRR